MENKFDYQSVPYGFAHCFNSQCVHKEECLHHLAATNCTSQCPTLSIINPNCIPADTTNCPHFRKALKCRVAWGIRHLLDNVAGAEDFAQESVVRAFVIDPDHAAVEVGQRAIQSRGTGAQLAPLAVLEAGIAMDAFFHA